ncbi:uncharacterized protein LY89DRAFT_292418 [Mollisia scopiformis]|uniref:Telomere length regulation protein conserved domain-containing protein n=1 Tax=Mollisia scopiformis TaxID=149040 RepID=A0A194XPU7_MOLSC|nr:uncharacterized protein LY89DRAFT_292418 [Mollisia scopiformis]KUJ22280.1 hypothetical protein LY89DRAFT_292418 [Mollisia scopiformis]
MDSLLTPVSTSYKNQEQNPPDALVEVFKPVAKSQAPSQVGTPVEALEILRNEPDYETLVLTLNYLDENTEGFVVTSPSPLAAQIVNALVSDVVPTYWVIFHEPRKAKSSEVAPRGKLKSSSELELLLSCLRSVTGLNAILLRLKQHIQEAKARKKEVGGHNVQDSLSILVQLLQALLQGSKTVYMFWMQICKSSDAVAKQKAVWNELLSAIAGGKLLGIAAEAEDVINDLSKSVQERSWAADGKQYGLWLAQNISYWAKKASPTSENGWSNCGELLGKSLRLGYSDTIVKELLTSLALGDAKYQPHLEKLLESLSNIEQRNVLYTVLNLLSRDYLSAAIPTEDNSEWWQSDSRAISAAAGLITAVIAKAETRKANLVSWLTNSSGAGVGEGIAIRRAALVTIAESKSDVESVFDKSLSQFGNKLYIKHTPTLQQEVHAQVLLLAAGYVHRTAPLRLTMMMRSGSHLGVVSNRLAASSPRARFLGMVVGEALSSLVDKGDKRMDFKIDEMTTSEAKWFKSLVHVKDMIGPIQGLIDGSLTKTSTPKKAQAHKPTSKPTSAPTGSKIVAIEEIEDDDDDEEQESDDDGLVPYQKLDSDVEDSDEDATLVTRNKPTAPVYVRDLITYLRDTENYDRQKLALSTAAPLIRRKANFGTEVSSHAQELATLLLGLQDKYEIENFQDMRIQGMIAILIALPLKMGQWYSKTFFDGDYSLSQRASVLTTLGLGARELGGFGSEDEALTATSKAIPNASFPSKTLPASMHKIYAAPSPTHKGPPSALDSLSTQLTNTMIAPMAATLADKITGPSILKIRTFSSRMAVEKKRKKPIANSLAKVVADGFFFPLTGRFFIYLKAYGSSSSNVIFQPYLLSLFIKTLSLLLHASGPNTLSLPQMTAEFWDLLLGLRMQGVGDIVVMEALLFGFMTILELNEDKRRLVDAHGRQMLETQEWVEGVFGRVGAGGSEEDERVRMLAAGVLVRIREIVEKYQALLMGDLASF